MVVESLLEGQQVRVCHGSEHSDFVEGAGDLLGGGGGKGDLLHGVDESVFLAADLVDGGEGALAGLG